MITSLANSSPKGDEPKKMTAREREGGRNCMNCISLCLKNSVIQHPASCAMQSWRTRAGDLWTLNSHSALDTGSVCLALQPPIFWRNSNNILCNFYFV
ncbi:hypothetical protein QQF64_012188 [Cirrhinus molitorella]|uniref:Uncharacterized protein n=1 Tax=Cirrhinus molitorella TaxID=172907 RepID=A0ABR3LUS0_9TELE